MSDKHGIRRLSLHFIYRRAWRRPRRKDQGVKHERKYTHTTDRAR